MEDLSQRPAKMYMGVAAIVQDFEEHLSYSVGRRVDEVWALWNPAENIRHQESAIVFIVENEQFEVEGTKSDLQLSWNSIDLSNSPPPLYIPRQTSEWIDVIDLYWKKDFPPLDDLVVGRTLKEIRVAKTSGLGLCIEFSFDSSVIAIYDHNDATGLYFHNVSSLGVLEEAVFD